MIKLPKLNPKNKAMRNLPAINPQNVHSYLISSGYNLLTNEDSVILHGRKFGKSPVIMKEISC